MKDWNPWAPETVTVLGLARGPALPGAGMLANQATHTQRARVPAYTAKDGAGRHRRAPIPSNLTGVSAAQVGPDTGSLHSSTVALAVHFKSSSAALQAGSARPPAPARRHLPAWRRPLPLPVTVSGNHWHSAGEPCPAVTEHSGFKYRPAYCQCDGCALWAKKLRLRPGGHRGYRD